MKKTLKITGMHCEKCSERCTRALNAIKGVRAEVNLKKGTATVECDEGVDDAMLVTAVEETGFDCEVL